jgi:hypothetical protein
MLHALPLAFSLTLLLFQWIIFGHVVIRQSDICPKRQKRTFGNLALVTNIIIKLINGSEGYVAGLLVTHGSCALCGWESGDTVRIDVHLLSVK